MSDKLTRPGSLGAGQMGIDRRTTQDLVNLKREIEEVAGRRTIVTPARQTLLTSSEGNWFYSIADGFNEYGAVDHIIPWTSLNTLPGYGASKPFSPDYTMLILEDDGSLRIEYSPLYTTIGYLNEYNYRYQTVYDFEIDGAYALLDITEVGGEVWASSGMRLPVTPYYMADERLTYISFSGTSHCTFRSFQMGRTFTIYVNVKPTNLSAARVILANASAAYSFRLNIAATTGKLLLYASSNGTSFNLANGVSSTNGIPAGQYSDIKIVYDLQYIKVYINDNLEINQAATAPIHTAVGASASTTRGLRFGADSAGTAATKFVGWMTGIFLMNNIVWNGVRPIPANVPEIYIEDSTISQLVHDDLKLYWFDPMTMRMYRYRPTVLAGIRKEMFGLKYNIFNLTPVKGIMLQKGSTRLLTRTTYRSIITKIANNTSYSFNDRLGTVLKDMTIYTRQSPAYAWTQANKQFRSYHYGYQPVIVDDMSVKAYQPTASAYTGTGVDQGEDAFGTGNNTAAEMFVVVRRLF